ncbi:uncharacterized protein LOC136061030 isoform X2 [Quercus suber]|uniref:uncharacterized protein LOC136061030 isoform X2 n=1 Tax=Quercus suber TaxID=58331 RepID=UPI0032DEBB49
MPQIPLATMTRFVRTLNLHRLSIHLISVSGASKLLANILYSWAYLLTVGNLIARWDDETFRVSFEKGVQMQEAMWERQHELATDKIYASFQAMHPNL